MSRNLSHALWACPPYWNTVSLHSTAVDHCTISYGTGRVVGTVVIHVPQHTYIFYAVKRYC